MHLTFWPMISRMQTEVIFIYSSFYRFHGQAHRQKDKHNQEISLVSVWTVNIQTLCVVQTFSPQASSGYGS